MDGKWPSHVQIPVGELLLDAGFRALCDKCCGHFLATAQSEIELTMEEDLHISLSRPFSMVFHSIPSFVKELATLPTFGMNCIPILIGEGYAVLANEAGTTAFLCILLASQTCAYLSRLVRHIDEVLQRFHLAPYHKDPIFHVSIASFAIAPSHTALLVGWREPQMILVRPAPSALSLLSAYDSSDDEDRSEEAATEEGSLAVMIAADRIVCHIGNRHCERVFGVTDFHWPG